MVKSRFITNPGQQQSYETKDKSAGADQKTQTQSIGSTIAKALHSQDEAAFQGAQSPRGRRKQGDAPGHDDQREFHSRQAQAQHAHRKPDLEDLRHPHQRGDHQALPQQGGLFAGQRPQLTLSFPDTFYRTTREPPGDRTKWSLAANYRPEIQGG